MAALADKQILAKVPYQRQRTFRFGGESRFGDEPTQGARVGRIRPHDKRSVAVGKISAGEAPPHTVNGFVFPTPLPKNASEPPRGTIGLSATSVERWRFSQPTPTRLPPDAHDYLSKLGPGCYPDPERPEALRVPNHPTHDTPGPSWYIGAGGPQRSKGSEICTADCPMLDRQSAFGKRVLSNQANGSSASFGAVCERRMVGLQPPSKEALDALPIALRKQRQGHTLDAAELRALAETSRRTLEGAPSLGLPLDALSRSLSRSAFEGGLKGSQSFSFGGSNSALRFYDEQPGAIAKLNRSRSQATPKEHLPHFGRTGGIAFRQEPETSPGPGDYRHEASFDRTGRREKSDQHQLSFSRSQPSITIVGRKDLRKLTGAPDEVPAPGTYF